jgi:LysM repeat protein
MQWEKKICIRITARRIVAAILIAASSVNLIIVGAAFEAASPTAGTRTSSALTQIQTLTSYVPTATTENPVAQISSTVETVTLTSSPSSTSTPTSTDTPTSTSTSSPTATLCAPRSYWFIYYVESGDTLSALARLTGSTVEELMLANCLPDTRIYKGQLLYAPRPVIRTPTPTDTTKPDLPPVVTIISASVGSTYDYEGYDEVLGLGYTSVVLEGSAVDSEAGILSGSSLHWSTDRTDIYKDPFLGTGSVVRAILYSNICSGVWHTITLTATDSQGNVSVASVKIFIGSSLCQVGTNPQDAWSL